MAGVAVVVACDVSGVFAHGLHAVVTTEAGTSYLQVVHANNRQEVVLGMTGLAVVLGQDVSHRPGSRVHASPLRVASPARSGRAFEDSLDMAVFAGQIAVEAPELVSRRKVVKLSALNRHGARRHESKQQQAQEQ